MSQSGCRTSLFHSNDNNFIARVPAHNIVTYASPYKQFYGITFNIAS